MSKIAIVGNGFDLRHGFNTSYRDFMEYYKSSIEKKNVIIQYYDRLGRCNGWIDFEQDLLLFLKYLSKLRSSYRLAGFMQDYEINQSEFIDSLDSKAFYETIKSMDYDFWISDNIGSILIELENDTWYRELVDQVLKDYNEIREELKKYLFSEVNTKLGNVQVLSTSEIDDLKSADVVYTFNYTNLLEAYGIGDINYVHGSLESDIILGLPFDESMDITAFHHVFKIIQSIEIGSNNSLVKGYTDPVQLCFIGLSFGQSDHYFFQEIKDWINRFYDNKGVALPKVTFKFYTHSKESKLECLYNLRIFLGEEMITRFNLGNQIQFVPYEQVNSNEW